MEKFWNSFRMFEWRIRKMLNLKNQSIAPLCWKQSKFGNSHLPTTEFEESLSTQQKQKLLKIMEEMKMASRLSNKFPTSIRDKDWKVILDCQTRKQRLDHLIFLSKVEDLRSRERMKKEKMKSGKSSIDIDGYQLLLRPTRNQKKYEWLNVVKSYRIGAPKLVVDCQFLPFLSPRGRGLTALQLQYINSENKELANPFILYFANFDAENETVKKLRKDKLQTIDSKDGLLPIVTNRCFTEHFEKESIVYLSPDGEEILENVEDDKVYVIGGIVDRVPEHGIDKEASKNAAMRAGVKSYQLPIDRYIEFKSGSRFLTLVAVMHILDEVRSHGSWERAFKKWIPKRNVKTKEEKNVGALQHHQKIREFNSQVLKMIDEKMGKDENENNRPS